MEVLVLGLCRTGTLSMTIALNELGYKNVYHMSSATAHHSHPDLWIEALNAKFGSKPKPEVLTTQFFDRILYGYNAVTDIPCACFVPELLAAYPKAKVILTARSTSSWQVSMLRTIHALQSSRSNLFLYFSSTHLKKLSHLMDLIFIHYFRDDIRLHGPSVFDDHNEMVRSIAKKQKREFLEFQLGDGWGPLCAFLGKEIPATPYPHVNEMKRWRASFGLGITPWKVVFTGILFILVGCALWIWVVRV